MEAVKMIGVHDKIVKTKPPIPGAKTALRWKPDYYAHFAYWAARNSFTPANQLLALRELGRTSGSL
jgi:hypothetical protein